MAVKNVASLIKKFSSEKLGKMSVAGLDRDLQTNLAVMLENQMNFSVSNLFENDGSAETTAGNIDYGFSDATKFKPISLAMVRRAVPAMWALKWMPSQAIQTPVSLAYALRWYDDLSKTELYLPSNLDEFIGYGGTARKTLREIAETAKGSSYTDAVWLTANIGIVADTDVDPSLDGVVFTDSLITHYVKADGSVVLKANFAVGNVPSQGMIKVKVGSELIAIDEAYLYGATTADAEDWSVAKESVTMAGGAKNIRQFGVKLDTLPVYARTRKLSASYSLENASDLQSMAGVDLKREMVDILHTGVASEIDREGLWRMKKTAIIGDGGRKKIIKVAIPTASTTNVWGRYSAEMIDTLVKVITHQVNDIYQTTRIGTGNFVVCSAGVASALQFAPGFIQASGYKADVKVGRQIEVGKLADGVVVYMDSDSRSENEWILVGYKGSGVNDGGIIFSPYMMGIQSEAVSDTDFSPRVGVMSRYAFTDNLLGSGRYYRYVEFTGFNNLGFQY